MSLWQKSQSPVSWKLSHLHLSKIVDPKVLSKTCLLTFNLRDASRPKNKTPSKRPHLSRKTFLPDGLMLPVTTARSGFAWSRSLAEKLLSESPRDLETTITSRQNHDVFIPLRSSTPCSLAMQQRRAETSISKCHSSSHLHTSLR